MALCDRISPETQSQEERIKTALATQIATQFAQLREEAAKAQVAAAALASETALADYQQRVAAYNAVLAAEEEEGKRRAREAFLLEVPDPTVRLSIPFICT